MILWQTVNCWFYSAWRKRLIGDNGIRLVFLDNFCRSDIECCRNPWDFTPDVLREGRYWTTNLVRRYLNRRYKKLLLKE